MSKLPAFMFYPKDWISDPALQMSSDAAQGLWMRIICLSDQLPHRGRFVRRDGVTPLSNEQILNMVGGINEKRIAALKELEDNEVSKRDENGALYCKRIVIDEQQRQVWKANGKKGGRRPKDTGYVTVTPAAESPAIGYRTPEVIRYDIEKPIPFGIEADAIASLDFDRIEAAFIARWNATKGAIQTRGTGIHSKARELFKTRCFEPGWLADAETALKKFPLKCLTGAMSLSKFMEPETVSAINAGNYSFDPGRSGPVVSETKIVDPDIANQRNAKEAEHRRAIGVRRMEYRAALAEKWQVEAGLLTDKDITALDEMFPAEGLYGLKLRAEKPRATEAQQTSYRVTLFECLEMRAGGKSFDQLESEASQAQHVTEKGRES